MTTTTEKIAAALAAADACTVRANEHNLNAETILDSARAERDDLADEIAHDVAEPPDFDDGAATDRAFDRMEVARVGAQRCLAAGGTADDARMAAAEAIADHDAKIGEP